MKEVRPKAIKFALMENEKPQPELSSIAGLFTFMDHDTYFLRSVSPIKFEMDQSNKE